MEHINFSDMNTDDEKVKVVNRIIDEINIVKLSNDVHNAEVDVHNAEVNKYNESI